MVGQGRLALSFECYCPKAINALENGDLPLDNGTCLIYKIREGERRGRWQARHLWLVGSAEYGRV
jgi:hypothetical protein